MKRAISPMKRGREARAQWARLCRPLIVPGLCAAALLAPMVTAHPSWCDTIVLEGRLDSTVRVSKEMEWKVDRSLSQLVVRFALPAHFSNRAVSQDVEDLQLSFDPQPAKVEDERDHLGNGRKKVTWDRPTKDVRVTMIYDATVLVRLSAMESSAPFPLGKVAAEERQFLSPTEFVQSDSGEIGSLADELTKGARTEYGAVTSIMEYVADNIKYSYNPPASDALYTLHARSGNCTNMAHLSMALLRACNIPARMVGGTSLNKQWRIPIDDYKQIIQTMGQGGHAWIEVYFPDLGWLSYDPKQSKQFTSSRHVKETHGLDQKDIVDSWIGMPYAPAYSDRIDARFVRDDVQVRPKGSHSTPKSYLASNQMSARIEAIPVPTAVVLPEPEKQPLPEPAQPQEGREEDALPSPERVEPPVLPAPLPVPPVVSAQAPEPLPPSLPVGPDEPPQAEERAVQGSPPPVLPVTPPPPFTPEPNKERYIELGNMEFPNLVDTHKITGNRGVKILDAETAEYVTSSHVYAQAFRVETPIAVREISLAMHKFGGDGAIYVDLVADDEGKPGFAGFRSLPVFLDKLGRKEGYDWITFRLPEDGTCGFLKKGKYWIVLRHSGEAVMTWFYIPGKPYAGADDTRSTLKGHLWEDILTYDFVFKIGGLG